MKVKVIYKCDVCGIESESCEEILTCEAEHLNMTLREKIEYDILKEKVRIYEDIINGKVISELNIEDKEVSENSEDKDIKVHCGMDTGLMDICGKVIRTGDVLEMLLYGKAIVDISKQGVFKAYYSNSVGIKDIQLTRESIRRYKIRVIK